MPEPTEHPQPDRLEALLATLDAVNVVLDDVHREGDGDRQRAALLDLVLIDYLAVRPAER